VTRRIAKERRKVENFQEISGNQLVLKVLFMLVRAFYHLLRLTNHYSEWFVHWIINVAFIAHLCPPLTNSLFF